MENKVKPTIGVFVGIMNKERKILLIRRTKTYSIIPGKSFRGCWELLGGGVKVKDNMPYHHLSNELIREIDEETGIVLQIGHKLNQLDPMPAFFPVFFGKAQDLALVAVVKTSHKPSKGETTWVSFDELNELAKKYKPADKETGQDGEGLLGGEGKRMHCMALKCFSESNVTEASKLLYEIQKQW